MGLFCDNPSMTTATAEQALFDAGPYCAVELAAVDIPELQRFYEANPLYFETVMGEPPQPKSAKETFHAFPPDEMSFTRKWMLGFRDEAGALVAMADVIEDLIADDVWHVGLFIVATRLHGSGAARSLYQALEAWMKSGGARWLRLGVVVGNARAERFWEKCGYRDVRTREGVRMGERLNTLRVMMKPLGAGSVEEYLQLVPRDQGGTP
jgi:RimJ/RimL family protein N-acetyltransferase